MSTPTPINDLLQCSLRPNPARAFEPNVSLNRAETIIMTSKFWANGTRLKYYFFTSDGMASDQPAEVALVRKAFSTWQDLGIGIGFEETTDPASAQVRIAFVRGDGAWSYIGRDCLNIPVAEQTMNFGWDITSDPRTVGVAIHEIGHAIGMPHEHQNPQAGIVWNEQVVLETFSAPPNSWDEQTIRNNILNKLPKSEIRGSEWDPTSIMEYSFAPGLVTAPKPFDVEGIRPPGDRLSDKDRSWTRKFYPPIDDSQVPPLHVGQSVPLDLEAGEQASFTFSPASTRHYEIRTFGECDAVMVVFERKADGSEYVLGKDDSGKDENVYMRLRLRKGHSYHVNVRMIYRNPDSTASLMLW